MSSTSLWYATRASGIMALILLTLTMVLGMTTTTRARARNWPGFAQQEMHRRISMIAVVFLGIHVLTSVLDTFVTRERHATFRQAAGSAALRAGRESGLEGLWLAGAWTATGWPDTMESAVRSGVVGISIGERPCEERVLRTGSSQPSHVVVGEAIGSGRIVHLQDFPHEVVGVFDAGRIGIGL